LKVAEHGRTSTRIASRCESTFVVGSSRSRPSAIQWIFPTLLLIGLPFAPESPWWLVRRGRFSSAEHIVSRLGGPTVDAPLFVHQIQDTIALEDLHRASSTYLDCARGSDRRRTIIAMMVFVLQQVAGVVFVLGFSNYFFQLAGFNTANSFKLGVGVTAIGIVGNLIGCAAVNLAVGFSSLANTQAARWSEAAFVSVHGRGELAPALTTQTIIYNFVYQVGIGPLGYVIFAEVGSAKLRSKTVGIGIFVNSLCGMIANIVIPCVAQLDSGES
jgi:SP family general alpha glucoside:H+ symporter-like MFS transporter